MKSRRQSSGGSSAAAAAEGHTTHSGGGGCKMERKDVEKKRRLQMKALCLKLSSLIPPAARASHASSLLSVSEAAAAASSASNPNKDAVTQLDQLDSAAAYIKQLKERIAALKRRKEGGNKPQQVGGAASAAAAAAGSDGGVAVPVRMPVVEARCQDGTLDVVLISEAGRPFKLHEVITVLEQEGAEVISASFSVVGDKIFYTVHSQALCPRIGLDAARVSDRLHDLVQFLPAV
ncbi:hypothetical protein U9M48_020464 [Paspalum notatum var. saurae]|uniref:BHLH domain-containing protein n=1 Tax=Paspalum notatum var. saurae TaxID=547442 RepID=A0AAQ3WSN4_PASNO